MKHRQPDRSACGARNLLHDVVADDPLDRLIVDFEDLVSRQHSRFIRRRTDHRTDDEDFAVAHVDLNADAAEVSGRGLFERGPRLLGDEVGIRIELFEHSANRVVDERLAVDFLNVTAIDVFDGVDEQAIKFGVLFLPRRAAVGRLPTRHGGEAGGERHEMAVAKHLRDS